jgi:hypothetical protein
MEGEAEGTVLLVMNELGLLDEETHSRMRAYCQHCMQSEAYSYKSAQRIVRAADALRNSRRLADTACPLKLPPRPVTGGDMWRHSATNNRGRSAVGDTTRKCPKRLSRSPISQVASSIPVSPALNAEFMGIAAPGSSSMCVL